MYNYCYKEGNRKVGQKLFYEDAYITKFSAQGVHQRQDELGNWYIILSKTAFYPTGGGQPHDLGTLNDVPVVNIEEIDGEIRHYVREPLAHIDTVTGVIDWTRRFDHMQQHAGQHLLTAAFVELFNVPTVSFHLGKDTATIDLEVDELTAEMAAEAETLANKIILENRPIETKWVTNEEAQSFNLRKQLAVTDNIRLVIIPQFDYNGCGGTHPKSTAEVGQLKILNWEKEKQKVRVQFVCGQRVLKKLHEKQMVLLELIRTLNSPEEGLVTAAKRLLDQTKELDKTIEQLQEELLQFEASELLAASSPWNGQQVIQKVFQNETVQRLQKLARTIINKENDVNVFFVNENGDKLQFVCMRSSDASINMKEIIQQTLPLINGKGGGNEASAQGGGEALISGEELMKHMIKVNSFN